MADRFPLILNTNINQIQEIASGDNLDLTGSGIHNAGVITATSFSGPIVAGVGVSNITSGIGTFTDLRVGGDTSFSEDLVVTGNARVTGILTVGTSSIILNDSANTIKVGTALTLGHTQGLQFHTQNLHSTGFEVNQINASGIITATGADINGDLDVDGHTNLDNVSISGITTSGNINISSSGPRITFSDTNENPDFYIEINASQFLIQDATANAQRFRIQSNGVVDINGNTNFSGGIDVTGGPITATGDLDIDGHTNLDNVSIAGVTTMTGALTISNTVPHIDLNDTDNESDYRIRNVNGTFQILDIDQAGGTVFFQRETNADTTITGNLNVTNGVDVTGNVIASGNVTGVNGVFSGNVSVGGVLTYEDVTNVDSVGIITARSSIKVTNASANAGNYLEIKTNANSSSDIIKAGAGAFFIKGNNIFVGDDDSNKVYLGGYKDNYSFLNYNGNTKIRTENGGVFITGICSATSFSGDGSNLTGIDTDLVSDTSPQLGGNLDCNNKVVTLNDSTGSGNNRLKIGNAGDLQLFHQSNANYVSGEVDGKDLYVRTRRDLYLVCGDNSGGYRNVIYADNNGSARLYHPASAAVRLQTSNSGVSVTGSLTTSGTLTVQNSGQASFILGSTNAGGAFLGLDGDSNGDASGGDYSYLRHNTSGDLEIVANKPSGGANLRFYANAANLYLTLSSSGNLYPQTNNAQDLGTTAYRFRNIYVNDLQLSNEAKKDTGGNNVDGTWGDFTIQEGENDLFLINNRSGKKYKFNLTEVS